MATFTRFCEALSPRMQSFALIHLEGQPICWLVNVTDRPDEFLVTLCNNSHAMPWEGHARIRGQDIVEFEEWLAYRESGSTNGTLHCGVPANDVRTFRIRAARAFLSLRYSDVPWRALGFGAGK